MKTTISFILFTLLFTSIFAQEQSDTTAVESSDIEIDAEYPGGRSAMLRFLGNNINYPKKAIRKQIEGSVIIRFVIGENGKIVGSKILTGMPNCPECEKEALRVVRKMPKWKPALLNGEKVKSYFDLPVVFKLT